MAGDVSIDAQGVMPEKALAHWRSKTPVSSAALKEMSTAAQSRAFAVAGLARLDQVSELHASLYEAMQNGEPFAQWQKRVSEIIAANGWSGHRLENIFRTNVQTAYNAGRYAQMREVAAARPVWQYITVGDQRVRDAHAALSGMAFPADHEFWDEYYPPNGFRCRCTVRSLSSRQAERQSITVQSKVPSDLMYTDPATGMERMVASVAPAPGFAVNPGKTWLAGLAPRELATLDMPNLAHAKALESGLTPPLISLPAKHILPIGAGDILPDGLTDSAYLLAFLKEFGLKGLDGQFLHRLPGTGLPLVIDKSLFLNKSTGALKVNKAGRGPYLRLLARTLKDPYEIWHVPVEISGRSVSTLRLIRLFAGENQQIGGFGVFSLSGQGWHGSTLFNPRGENTKAMLEYLEKQRVGTLVYREK